MTQKSCAVGMRNAKLGNHLKDSMAFLFCCAVNPDLGEHHDQLFCDHAVSPSGYGGYKELCGFLQKYCKASDRILTASGALSDK